MWSPVVRLSPLVALAAMKKWTGPALVEGGVQRTVNTPVKDGEVCSIQESPVPAVQPPAGATAPSEQITRWSVPAVKLPAEAVVGALSKRAVSSKPKVAAALSATVTVRSCACPGV